MQSFETSQQFSFGTVTATAALSGGYQNELSPSIDDTLRAAAASCLVTIPQQLQAASQQIDIREGHGDDIGSSRITRAIMATFETGNGRVEISISSDSQGVAVYPPQTIQQVLKLVATAIAATIVKHADAAMIGLPAIADPFIKLEQSMRDWSSAGPADQLVSAGAHHQDVYGGSPQTGYGSDPARGGAIPRR